MSIPTSYILPAISALLGSPTHLRTYPNVFYLCFFSPFSPHPYHIFVFYQHPCNFLCVHLCFTLSLSFRSLVSVILEVFLPLSLFPLFYSFIVLHFLVYFHFFCLWSRFLPSCRKAINPAGPAAGSRQSLGSRS